MPDQGRARVKLNVGGSRFETTVATLTAHPDSYFGAAFSGRHTVQLDEDGCYFIDRDGRHFGAILNFLRTGKLRVPTCPANAEDLMEEVCYYSLEEAVASSSGAGRGEADYTRKEVWQMRQNGVVFFSGCSFAGLNLSYVDFSACKLRGSDFRGANLSHANFVSADIVGANFDGAIVNGINLHDCDASAEGPRGAREAAGCKWCRCRCGVLTSLHPPEAFGLQRSWQGYCRRCNSQVSHGDASVTEWLYSPELATAS